MSFIEQSKVRSMIKRFKTAIYSVFITILAGFLVAISFNEQGITGGNIGGAFVYLLIICVIPLFLLSFVSSSILEWFYKKYNIVKMLHKLIIGLFVTLLFYLGYILISWGMFDSLREIVIESLGILGLVITLVCTTIALSR